MQHGDKRVAFRKLTPATSGKKRPARRPLFAQYRSHRTPPDVPGSLSARPARSRLRKASLLILALLPIVLAAWVLSIVVPTGIAAWRASDKIFEPRVDRPQFVEQAPPAPTAMPESIRALLTATAEGTSVEALQTPLPLGVSPDSLVTPTLGTITHPDIVESDGSRPTETGTPGPPTATPAPLPDWNGSDPIHVLLLGIDTRPSEESQGRSDTMIVVRVDPVVKRVDMFSIPRDLVVEIPGFSEGVKINSAYPWGELYEIEGGGPALVAQTIELNFGIPIDYYATVDIPGLEDIVDTLGGIVIDSTSQLKDDQYPTDDFRFTRAYFPAGLQKLDGEEAVQYARTRHSDGDFKRAARQQQVLLALRVQILETGLISKLPDLIDDLGDSIRTDLSPRQTLSLASLAQEIDRSDIWLHTLAPYTFPTATEEGWFLLGDWDALRWIAQNLYQDPLATNIPGS